MAREEGSADLGVGARFGYRVVRTGSNDLFGTLLVSAKLRTVLLDRGPRLARVLAHQGVRVSQQRVWLVVVQQARIVVSAGINLVALLCVIVLLE